MELAFSPDGKTLASAGGWDKAVRLWDLSADTPAERHVLPGHTDAILSLAIAPGGQTLATGSRDYSTRLWDLGGVEPRQTAWFHGPSNGWITSVAFAPDGKLLACGKYHNRELRLWDVRQQPPREWAVLTPHEAAAFAPTGRLLATWRNAPGDVKGDYKAVRLWDLTRAEVGAPVRLEEPTAVSVVAFAPDGKALATGSADGNVRRWDLTADPPRDPLVFPGHTGKVMSVAFTPDGKQLASSDQNRRVLLRDAATGATLKEWVLGRPVSVVACAPDGRHLAVANLNGTIYILRLNLPDP